VEKGGEDKKEKSARKLGKRAAVVPSEIGGQRQIAGRGFVEVRERKRGTRGGLLTR